MAPASEKSNIFRRDRFVAASAGRPLILLVHGTNDQGPANCEPADLTQDHGWWWAGSAFCRWLALRLKTTSGQPGVIRFRWSGANSERERENAARRLAGEFGKFAEAGTSLHIIAHSHGGNVVRRALELREMSDGDAAKVVRSVTTLGTPFFHYSAFGRSMALAWSLVLLSLVAFGALQLWRWTEAEWLRGLVAAFFAGVVISLLASVVLAFRRLRYRSRAAVRALAASISWTNYCAKGDEAIRLLMSFNSTLRILRTSDTLLSWPTSVLVGLIALCLGVVVTVEVAFYRFTTNSPGIAPGHEPSAVTMAFLMTVIAILLLPSVVAAVALSTDWIMGRWQALIDQVVTNRLRKAVYGDDLGHGVSRVERYPWPGMPDPEERLPTKVQAAVDRHIRRSSRIMWPRLRAAIGDRTELVLKDAGSLVEQSLTWDELAHTVYGRVPEFADLVVARLVKTGDWSSCECGLSPEGVRAHWKSARRPASAPPPPEPLPPLPPIPVGHLPPSPNANAGIMRGTY